MTIPHFQFIVRLDMQDKKIYHANLVGKNGKVLSATETMKRTKSVHNNMGAQLEAMGNKDGLPVIVKDFSKSKQDKQPSYTVYADGSISEL